MYRLNINRFWTLVISVTVVIALSFSVEAVLSQALPGELRPEQGAEGAVGNIGVPVEINGVVKELQVGDVITTGTVTEVNKEDLLIQVLDSLQTAGIVETSTILGAIGYVSSLPNGVCDFNDVSIGSSVASDLITNETSTETIRFSVAEGCNLRFEGKSSDFDDTEQTDETLKDSSTGLGDTSWLVPIPIRAEVRSNQGTNRLDNDGACKSLDDASFTSHRYSNNGAPGHTTTLGDGELQSGIQPTMSMGIDIGNSSLKVATIGLVRLEDKAITVRIDDDDNITDNILEEDCAVFFAETNVRYNNDGSRTVRSLESICSSWENHGRFELLPGVSINLSATAGIEETFIWVTKACASNKFNTDRGVDTKGTFAINHADNLFLGSLREAGYSETSTLLSQLVNENYTLSVKNSLENGRGGERVNYSCRIDTLPSFRIDKAELRNAGRIKTINNKTYIQIGGGDTIASTGTLLIDAKRLGAAIGSKFGLGGSLVGFIAGALAGDIDVYQNPLLSDVFRALKAGELYVQIPEDDSTVNTYMECRAAFIKISESAGTSYTTAPVRSSPDTRTLESLDSYVTGFFPGITFSKSINVEVDDTSRPLTYSVSRRVEIPQSPRQVSVYNYRIPAYNYETRPVYNYETRSVYNYETRPVYNYRTITTYTTRTRDVYNYRTRSVYNYEQIKTTCKRRVWFVCVSWNYRNGKRIAPFTERVRVAPFTETVRTPFTERWRVSPFTERVRVAPYTERVRVSPYTGRVRVAPYTTTRSFTSPQYRSDYTRVAPYSRTETPAPRYEWRTMTVSSVIRSGSYPDRSVRALTYRKRTQQVSAVVDYNGNITSCTGVCRQHRSAISRAPTVATLNGVRDVTWSSTLASLRRVREYDRDNVIGNLNKSTVYEALSIVNGLSNRVRPFATGRNSLSLTTIKDKVQSANAVDLSSEPLLHNRRTRRYNEIRARF